MRAALAALALAAPLVAQDVVVRGDVVHTLAGPPIVDGIVWIDDGKIIRVGPASEITPPAGVEILRARVVTPGLVDARSVVGLAGQLNQPHDQDQLEGSAPLQPELRAIDAYDPRERLVEWVRGFGVTTLHTGHAPGRVISGQTIVVKTTGDTVDEALVRPFAMVAATLGEGALDDEDAPGTRAKAVALLRAELIAAREYAEKRADPADDAEPLARDLRKEALAAVLAREVPLLVAAHRAHDIETALRIAREFEIDLVLDGAAEAYLMLDEIRAANVPVIAHAPMVRPGGERENATMELAQILREAGVLTALQSGYESYVPKTRVVLFEAAIAARYGLPFEDALALVTIDAARILKLDDRIGSLEVGKDGDVALFDGDPFEYTTHCTGVVIEGVVVSREVR